MAVFPNSECAILCYWMINESVKPLTAAQISVTTTVYNAAIAQTSVTDVQWRNFNLFAAWRNPYYLVWRDYQNYSVSSLLTSLVSYYDFEGNANDATSTNNGTNSGCTFGTSYGKIGQGVTNTAGTNYISIGSVSSFSFIKNTGVFSYNYWLKPLASGNTIRTINNINSYGGHGLYNLDIVDTYSQFSVANSSGSVYALAAATFSRLIRGTAWRMITVVGDGTWIYYYIDTVLIMRFNIGTLATGNDPNIMRIFGIPSGSGSNQFYFDELGIWSKALNFIEMNKLYNSGAGKTYPFT